jgi:hypothetical protein
VSIRKDLAALDRAVYLISQFTGGAPQPGVADRYPRG